MADTMWDLPLHDIIIPICAWIVVLALYIYELFKRLSHNVREDGKYYPNYFYHMRNGWVKQNHCTLQAVANSTRDYLRVIIFFAANSAVLGAIVCGYAARAYNSADDASDYYLVLKLGVSGFIFFVIFFLYLNSIRYGTQFHFLMNVEKANGVPMNLRVIETVFHRSFFFHTAGLRFHLVLIPLFAWALSSWALLAILPLYIYLLRSYNDLSFIEVDLEEMYQDSVHSVLGKGKTKSGQVQQLGKA